MKSFKSRLAVVVMTAGSVAGGFLGYRFVQNTEFARAEQRVEATREQLSHVEDLSTVFRDVGKAVEPSVVNIQVTKKVKGAGRSFHFNDDMLRRFFVRQHRNNNNDNNDGDQQDNPEDLMPGPGDDGSFEQVGTGSGVIIEVTDGSGYILTNNHVAGGAEEMRITLSDGREIPPSHAHLVGADAKTDLAVVKIDAPRLIAAKWGNSDMLSKGDWILAFGSPFGYVGSMTHGIVSALNRQTGILNGPFSYEEFIQVDAPINPGNSGGPLVSIHGEVVGINTAIASRTGGFQGIGFAIPSNVAHFVYTNLKEKGKVTRGWLGVKIQDVAQMPPGLANDFGYKGSTGVFVPEVLADTPAYGKLQKGDIITSIDGKPVDTSIQLRNNIAATPPNSEVTLGVFRDGKTQDVRLKLGEQPETLLASEHGGPNQGPNRNGEPSSLETLGMRLSDLTDARAQQMDLGDTKGALVTSVKPRSPAARAGIVAGDVITQVGRQEITNATTARDVLAKADLNKGVRVYVTNRNGSRFVFLRTSED
jgi:serine protease Do